MKDLTYGPFNWSGGELAVLSSMSSLHKSCLEITRMMSESEKRAAHSNSLISAPVTPASLETDGFIPSVLPVVTRGGGLRMQRHETKRGRFLKAVPHTAKAALCALSPREDIRSSEWQWIVSSRADTFGLLVACVLWHRISGTESGAYSHIGENPDPPLQPVNRYMLPLIKAGKC